MQTRKEEIKISNLELKEEKSLLNSSMIPLNLSNKNFDFLMKIYEKALCEIYETLTQVKVKLNQIYGYDVINNITSRIKSPESIVNKLRKKHYEVNLKNIVEYIDDVAGLRIACPLKNDIYTIIEIINQLPNIKIIEHKDYLVKPKKSGYSGYHIIVEVPVEVEKEKVLVKAEIQIRTMAMDFWATNEHKVRYKSNKKLSMIDSKKLTTYAKIINILDEKMMEIYNKQEIEA